MTTLTIPNSYQWHRPLRPLFEQAVSLYQAGQRGAAGYFDRAQTAYLASLGQNAQELYDFAEDFVKYDGEPDFETVLLVTAVRRDYFLQVQGGRLSERTVAMADLPSKNDELGGIVWLPRLLRKADAKLRGEMPADLMYGCAGDRRFLREYNVHPADFLRQVWASGGNERSTLEFIRRTRAAAAE